MPIFQEIPGELYASGDRWIHQCLECECLNGEVDCWPLTCPSTCPRSSSTPQPYSSTRQPCCSQNHLPGCDSRSAVNSTDLCWGCTRQVGIYQVFLSRLRMILHELLTCISFKEIPVQLTSSYPLKPLFHRKNLGMYFFKSKTDNFQLRGCKIDEGSAVLCNTCTMKQIDRVDLFICVIEYN